MTNSTLNHPPHSFDRATNLFRESEIGFRASVTDEYSSGTGKFEGIAAALVTRAMLGQQSAEQVPVSLTINYMVPVVVGPLEIGVALVSGRRGRPDALCHWMAEVQQGGETAVSATAVFAKERQENTMAKAPSGMLPPIELERNSGESHASFMKHYDLRWLQRIARKHASPQEQSAFWLRDHPPRALDFPALASLCVLVGTASGVGSAGGALQPMTTSTYFHCTVEDLQE